MNLDMTQRLESIELSLLKIKNEMKFNEEDNILKDLLKITNVLLDIVKTNKEAFEIKSKVNKEFLNEE